MTKFTKDHEYITADGTVGITPMPRSNWATSCSSSCPRSARS